MKKKHLYIVVGILLFLGVFYFSYKGVILYLYTIDTDLYHDVVDGLNVKNTMTVKKHPLKEGEYLTFQDIKIKNDFQDFVILDSDHSDSFVKYVLYDENHSVKASFWIGLDEMYLTYLKKDPSLFASDNLIPTNINLDPFLEKKLINTDLELFTYLRKQDKVKFNVFTSAKEIKENYTVQLVSSIMLPAADSLTIIDGDYKGYIFNMKSSVREVSLLKNQKRYVLTFLNTEYFTEEYIAQLLNTVSFS